VGDRGRDVFAREEAGAKECLDEDAAHFAGADHGDA
jgi:hypothetical protein